MNLVGDSRSRPPSIPNSEAEYRDGLNVNDKKNYSNKVPGGKITVLAVKKGFSGEITWQFDGGDLFTRPVHPYQRFDSSE